MSIGFVHLSDIHFGQETGGVVRVHNDVKARLIDDVRCIVRTLKSGHAAGIIVTGDIAFAGRYCEYKAAAKWLDQIANAAGCAISDIQIVPGNHDIDRDEITPATRIMIERIVDEGEPELDLFLASDGDRDLLFRRFAAYRSFAEGYRCSLDTNAASAEERVARLSPERTIRLIRLNSALICSKNDTKGDLLLGARQRVMKAGPGEELVVLSHHPLDWFQDSEDARRFIRSRARVFISGHEHCPSIEVQDTAECGTLMMLAAGATVPPESVGSFTYRYNLIEFEWESEQDALRAHVRPRAWVDELKRFRADNVGLCGGDQSHLLTCTNWRNAHREESTANEDRFKSGCYDDIVVTVSTEDHPLNSKDETVDDDYSLLLLLFFRDISRDQRLKILVNLEAIPPDWTGTLSEAFERGAFDGLVKDGRIDELRSEIRKVALV
jgi:hypothetical protein